MFTIAIILFPGLNTEAETKRAIEEVGMGAMLVRWNDESTNISKFEGYVIGGGFAYEDRGRAGLIASKDPIIDKLKKEALRGKPILGICNGAQILVESGLIPGVPNLDVALCVAQNKRIKDGRILGTGYYNTWVHFKSSVPQKRCAFTFAIPEGTILHAPIAHGEGRFVTAHVTLFPQLIENRQIVFRYCSEDGLIKDEFPINPTGSTFNTAAICNPEGNVMAIMPHPERGYLAPAPEIFHAMKMYMFDQKHPKYLVNPLQLQSIKEIPTTTYQPGINAIELISELLIVDTERETIQQTLKRQGFTLVQLKKYTHYEITFFTEFTYDDIKKIIQAGELMNVEKEIIRVKIKDKIMRYEKETRRFLEENAGEFPHTLDLCEEVTDSVAKEQVQTTESAKDFLEYSSLMHKTHTLLVREKEDCIGQAKTYAMSRALPHLKLSISRSLVWVIKGIENERDFHRLCKTYMLYSPHTHHFVYYL